MTALQPRRYIGTAAALAAYRAGRPVVVDQVLLADGYPVVRVRLPTELPRRHHPGVAVAGAVVVLGGAVAVGWLLLRWVFAHAWQLGALAALVTLLVAGRNLPSKPGTGRRTR